MDFLSRKICLTLFLGIVLFMGITYAIQSRSESSLREGVSRREGRGREGSRGKERKGRRAELKRISIDVDFEEPLRKCSKGNAYLVSKLKNTLFDPPLSTK